MNDTWCLGSQYWSYNLKSDYKRPNFGILLDMVGAENAVFPKEEISRKFAGFQQTPTKNEIKITVQKILLD